MGQTRPTFVYRLLYKGTQEEVRGAHGMIPLPGSQAAAAGCHSCMTQSKACCVTAACYGDMELHLTLRVL